MVLRLPLLLLLLSATLALQPTRPHAASAPLLLSTALRAQAPSEGQPAPIAANPWAALSAQLVETELVPDQALGLRERPGYAFGLGSDRWSASRYEGTVEGWSGQSVNWVSRSLLRRAAVTEDDSAAAVAADSTSGVGTVVAALDMNFYVTPVFDVPHARLTATSTADRHLLCVDYLPRVELATNMDYFDRYFQGVEEAMLVETAAAAAACGVAPMAAPDTVLSRMLLSPFALRIQVNAAAPGGLEALQKLGLRHIQRWHRWLSQATEVPVDRRQALYDRDERLQKLHFEEQKFRFARIMGASFAPKAAELSAAVMGPALGKQPYYYLGSDEFANK